MNGHIRKVEELMRKAGQEIPDEPVIPSLRIRELRARLIAEEAVEAINALGFAVIIINDTMLDLNPHIIRPDLEKIIDGCCDLRVVSTGTLSACGISGNHNNEFQEEIDNNNLTKISDTPEKDEYGKLLKPDTWKPPRIKEMLKSIREDN